jgi:hypothetical protein
MKHCATACKLLDAPASVDDRASRHTPCSAIGQQWGGPAEPSTGREPTGEIASQPETAKRQINWLLGRRFSRHYLSGTASPAGGGDSLLMMNGVLAHQ